MSASEAVGALAPRRLVVVNSAANGIGLFAARAFAEKGMRVALVDRTGNALEVAAVGIEGGTAHALDVANPMHWSRWPRK